MIYEDISCNGAWGSDDIARENVTPEEAAGREKLMVATELKLMLMVIDRLKVAVCRRAAREVEAKGVASDAAELWIRQKVEFDSGFAENVMQAVTSSFFLLLLCDVLDIAVPEPFLLNKLGEMILARAEEKRESENNFLS